MVESVWRGGLRGAVRTAIVESNISTLRRELKKIHKLSKADSLEIIKGALLQIYTSSGNQENFEQALKCLRIVYQKTLSAQGKAVRKVDGAKEEGLGFAKGEITGLLISVLPEVVQAGKALGNVLETLPRRFKEFQGVKRVGMGALERQKASAAAIKAISMLLLEKAGMSKVAIKKVLNSEDKEMKAALEAMAIYVIEEINISQSEITVEDAAEIVTDEREQIINKVLEKNIEGLIGQAALVPISFKVNPVLYDYSQQEEAVQKECVQKGMKQIVNGGDGNTEWDSKLVQALLFKSQVQMPKGARKLLGECVNVIEAGASSLKFSATAVVIGALTVPPVGWAAGCILFGQSLNKLMSSTAVKAIGKAMCTPFAFACDTVGYIVAASLGKTTLYRPITRKLWKQEPSYKISPISKVELAAIISAPMSLKKVQQTDIASRAKQQETLKGRGEMAKI